MSELSSWMRSFLLIWQKCFNYEIHVQVINLNVLVEILVQQSNLYSQQNGRNFLISAKEMKAFNGVKYAMAVNQLPRIPMYWDRDHLVGNIDIQNIFASIQNIFTISVNCHSVNINYWIQCNRCYSQII